MDYLNRELSWIDFNERVLAEACSSSVPLLERLKFIGIVSSNFDEFFMVRVAGLQELYKSGHPSNELGNLSAEILLKGIVQKTRRLFDIQEAVLNTEILPQLKAHGFAYCKPEECSESERRFLADYFYRRLYPIITPQVSENEQALADSVANVRLHVGFLLSGDAGGQERLAIVPVPSAPRFVFLQSDHAKKVRFVLIDELIRYFGGAFFPGCRITGTGIFKINRSASMTVDDSSDDGFIEALEEVLIRRRYSFVVRMTSTHESPALVRRMSDLFQLGEKDIYLSEAPIGLSSFAKITEIDGFKRLRNEKWKHFAHPAFPSDGTL